MSFRFALCSEVFRGPIEDAIDRVAHHGYEGIEIAPFQVAESVDDVPPARRAEIRRRAADAGIEIAGLHWLLVSPKGLHITTADSAGRQRTADYLVSLARFCADLGGKVLVLGSPQQRNLEEGTSPEQAFERAAEALRPVGQACGDAGVRLLLEPLHPRETDFLTHVEEAVRLVDAVDSPHVGFMLDCKAMSGFPDGVEGTIRRWGGRAGHIHTNEPDGKGPGLGQLDFGSVLRAIEESGYEGWISTEPFDYAPDPDTVARVALETLRAAAAGSPEGGGPA